MIATINKCKTYKELEEVIDNFNALVERKKKKLDFECVPFGEWLSNMIDYNGYTKKYFAELMNCTPHQVRNWCNENSIPSEPNFYKMCEILKVSEKELRKKVEEAQAKRNVMLKKGCINYEQQ